MLTSTVVTAEILFCSLQIHHFNFELHLLHRSSPESPATPPSIVDVEVSPPSVNEDDAIRSTAVPAEGALMVWWLVCLPLKILPLQHPSTMSATALVPLRVLLLVAFDPLNEFLSRRKGFRTTSNRTCFKSCPSPPRLLLAFLILQ